MGKITSLIAAAETTKAHIIGLAETKLNKTTPKVDGYKWVNKPRLNRPGGGVALLIREDIQHIVEQVTDLEDDEQEIAWIRLKQTGNNVYVGIYYGPQEKCSNEEAERQYAQLTAQINKLKSDGQIILMGDFNAKLKVDKLEIQQEMSRNGEYLQKMIEDTQTVPVTLNADKGMWTRVKRKDTNERSIIDYVIMSNDIAQTTNLIQIDEEGSVRLKGKEETDHNTIVVETSVPAPQRTSKEQITNLKDPEGWEKFNKAIEEAWKNNPPTTYDQYEQAIKEAMKKSFRKITITKGKYKYKLTEIAKTLKKNKKTAKKEFQKATKEEKAAKLELYFQAQRELKNEIGKIEEYRVEQRINRIIKEGGAGSNHFWKIRKKILSQGQNEQYDLVTEEGVKVTDPEQTKEYIANYYESLYRAREGAETYKEWTDHITKCVNDMDNSTLEEEPDFTQKELEKVIKSLKRGKSSGPDGIPNEIFIESTQATRETHRNIMNDILHTIQIPEQWKEVDLKRLYKGKGAKGKCSNERGITLASNVGKFFERLVNNRIGPQVEMTDAQAGGTKGRATVDHILVLKELAHIAKKDKKQLILVYLDVTKAYDKAWLDAIMYVLQKRGIRTKLWKLVKELNTDLTTTVQTKHGPTRKIQITDSIRQGGVLSVTMYALMMDETNKALKETELGIKIPGTNTTIPCLLWMDDVVLAETEPKRTQEELDITNHISQKYHVEYGMPKTKYLRTRGSSEPLQLKLGDRNIDETEKYTYLGEINNRKMNLTDQIKNINSKAEAAYQTLLAVTEDRDFRGIKMASVWLLVSTCIMPIITYASETWRSNKQETKKLNQILDKIVRRILMTPDSTPREALYMESGLLDVETTAEIKRLNMKARLNREKSQMMELILGNPDCLWEGETKNTMRKHSIEPHELEGSKYSTKVTIKRKVQDSFRMRITESGKEKSKMRYFSESKPNWTPGRRAKYMDELTRKQVSLIFKARTRMLKFKGNYKNGHKDQACRACKNEAETQNHVLEECPAIHQDTSTKIEKAQLFSEDTGTLRKVSEKLEKIMDRLE